MIEVRRLALDEEDAECGITEAWERVTGDSVYGVWAGRYEEDWAVEVNVMECIREEPLESELRNRITAALRTVSGVRSAEEEDRERWLVCGSASGPDLVRAAARVADDLSGEIEERRAEAAVREQNEERKADRRRRLGRLGFLVR